MGAAEIVDDGMPLGIWETTYAVEASAQNGCTATPCRKFVGNRFHVGPLCRNHVARQRENCPVVCTRRLSSVLFDKVMMMMGDPSDMRLFIGRQEDVAFSDLIWVAVLHAFPQAVLQLHLLLFAGGAALLRGDWPDYTGRPPSLFEETNPDWAPTFLLGYGSKHAGPARHDRNELILALLYRPPSGSLTRASDDIAIRAFPNVMLRKPFTKNPFIKERGRIHVKLYE
ncbi:hypothetical protein HPB49_002470 [Dermacentor silvarum]|uniref:Uncharacterized protein n=1 Tax=Dermacentor silvarum TaxID=543639 RepID=A0ACB8DSW2_DERSI|nr:hypothetical protein HPB49_002470 [Dermacentor silvarum]